MAIEIRILGPQDAAVLTHIAPEVFDEPIHPRWCQEFLCTANHHLAVACDGELVVGMASAYDYGHPDKPVELRIDEIGVSPRYRRHGIGRQLMQAMFNLADEIGCREVWVEADHDDNAAQAFYASLGGEPDPLVMYTFTRPALSTGSAP